MKRILENYLRLLFPFPPSVRIIEYELIHSSLHFPFFFFSLPSPNGGRSEKYNYHSFMWKETSSSLLSFPFLLLLSRTRRGNRYGHLGGPFPPSFPPRDKKIRPRPPFCSSFPPSLFPPLLREKKKARLFPPPPPSSQVPYVKSYKGNCIPPSPFPFSSPRRSLPPFFLSPESKRDEKALAAETPLSLLGWRGLLPLLADSRKRFGGTSFFSPPPLPPKVYGGVIPALSSSPFFPPFW